ncbi:hypothetical protein H6A21_10830, partial [Collinsella tanakaei]|nr:hypothetical protein [Collinsella tanakaei]
LLESMLGEVSYQTVPATMLVRCAGREFSVPRRMIGRWIGNTYLDGFDRISPAFLNSTGLM